MPDSFIPDSQDSFQGDSFIPDKAPTDWRTMAGQGAVNFGTDLAKGAGAELASTVFHGGDLIRRAFGMNRVIQRPEVQAGITPPATLAGHLGSGIMTGLELAAPGLEEAKGVGLIGNAASMGMRAAGVEGLRTGGDVGSMAKVGAVAATAPLIITPAVRGVTKLIAATWGKALGVSGDTITSAASKLDQDSADAFKLAMRSKDAEAGILNDFADTVEGVAKKRATDYTQAFSKLDQSVTIPKTPIANDVMDELKNFHVEASSGLHDLNFSGGKLGNITRVRDRELIQDAVNKIYLEPPSVMAMDQLKQTMGDYAKESSPDVAPFFFRMRKSIEKQLDANVPGYEAMTADYARASDLLTQVRKELSVGNTNPGVTMRKIANALNQNNDYKKILIESLDQAAGSHLSSTLEGYSFGKVMPKGLAGVGEGLFALHNPGALAKIALIGSPRVAGEMLALISALRRMTPMAMRGLPSAAANVAAPTIVAAPAGLPSPGLTPPQTSPQ